MIELSATATGRLLQVKKARGQRFDPAAQGWVIGETGLTLTGPPTGPQ